jgi:hypothetical protein
VELYLIKRTCIEQQQNKSGVASPMISVSVDMPENAQDKKINPTLAIRTLEAIMSIKIEGQTDLNRYLEKRSHLA